MKMSSSPFESSIWQIIRASQKDDHYLSKLGIDLDQSVKLLFGARFWIRSQELLTNSTKLLYYLLTTTSGRQTLGEEYSNIVQVVPELSIPSFTKRLSLSLLYTFHSTLLQKCTTLLHDFIDKYFRRDYSLDEFRNDVQYLFHLLQALNLASFYFSGAYLDLSKRLLGIGYFSTFQRQSLSPLNHSTSKLLGYLSLLQIILSLYSKYRVLKPFSSSEHSATSNATSDPASSDDIGPKCLLCFSKRTNPTLIECGHIFCWQCLTNWLQYRNECPTCRRVVQSNRLVFLHNYK